jgi:uncharacterized membrane protein YbhN (UPF0104 family)
MALCVGVLVVALVHEWPEVQDHLDELNPFGLAGAIVVAFLAALPLCESWRVLMRNLGSPLPRRASYRIFFLGQLAKYVPGSMWSVIAHAEVASDHGVARPRTATASLLNLGVVAATAALVGIPAVFIAAGGRPVVWLGLAVVPVLLVALHPRVVNRGINYALRRLGRPPLDAPISGRALLAAAGWAAIAWIAYGLHTALLVRSLGVTDGRVFIVSTCGFALAWVVGLLVPFAPAGGGVRELVLVGALSPVAPSPVGLAVAIISRVTLTVVDLVLAAIAAALGRNGSNRAAREPGVDDESTVPLP